MKSNNCINIILKNNKKGHEIIISAIVFLVLWFITSIIWSIWFDGVTNPILGAITSGVVIGGITLVINK